jgi:hypothetical protein
MDLFLAQRSAKGALQVAPGADIRKALIELAQRANLSKNEEVMQSGNTLVRVLPDTTETVINLLQEETVWEINGECLVSTLLGRESIGPIPILDDERKLIKTVAEKINSERNRTQDVLNLSLIHI